MPGATVVILRHGRTAWSGQGRFAGHTDVPLDAAGLGQARAAAAAIARLRPSGLVTSDLARARRTAEVVAAAAGGVAVALDRRLREECLGSWEGLTRADAAARFPDEFARWRGGYLGPSAQREGLAAVADRATGAVRDALAGLAAAAPVLVVVTHVNTAVALGGRLLGEADGSPAAVAACDLAPGAFVVLGCDGAGRWRLRPAGPAGPTTGTSQAARTGGPGGPAGPAGPAEPAARAG